MSQNSQPSSRKVSNAQQREPCTYPMACPRCGKRQAMGASCCGWKVAYNVASRHVVLERQLTLNQLIEPQSRFIVPGIVRHQGIPMDVLRLLGREQHNAPRIVKQSRLQHQGGKRAGIAYVAPAQRRPQAATFVISQQTPVQAAKVMGQRTVMNAEPPIPGTRWSRTDHSYCRTWQ